MENTESQSQSGLNVLEANALTKIAGTPSKTPSITNQSVLDDMQKLYEQKQAEKNYWLQDLADAQAWWSGGVAGPTSGLALRAQTRAAQAKELQDLEMALSQGKINIAQLGEANAALGSPKAGIDGLPTGGAQAAESIAPDGVYTIRGVRVPVQVFKAYQAYLKQGNLSKANEVFDNYTKEETKFLTAPATYKQEDYFDRNAGEMDRRTPFEVRGGANQPSAVMPPSTTPITTPSASVNASPQDAIKAGIPVISGYRDEDKQAKLYVASQQPGYSGPPVAKPGQSLHQTGEAIDVADFKKLKPEQLKWLRENGYQQTMPDTDPNHFAKIGTPKTTSTIATTQVSATTPTATGAPKTYGQYLTEQAGKKAYVEKSEAKAGEAVGIRQGAFESAAVDASKDLQNANVMLNIIDEHPEAVGLSYKNRALGTTTEIIKFLTNKDIEPAVRRAALSKEAIEAGNIFDSLAQANNLKFRQSVYKGTGQVSDFETKLSERASGLARDNSLEANRFFATVAAENYRTLDKLGREWHTFKKNNPSADFADFEQSNIWKDAQAERETRLKTYFPEIDRSSLGFGSKEEPKNAKPNEIEDWRKRYGTKKD